jgi:hypothetical protein
MNEPRYFMAIFSVKYFDANKNKHLFKTISSYVTLYERFEETIDRFCERFAKQDFTLVDISVFTAERDFKIEWETIKADDNISWLLKNRTLLERRPDIADKNVFHLEGHKPRTYR